MTYEEFLKSKMMIAPDGGIDIGPSEVNPALNPHQKDAILWACKGGNRALFESFGLGKTSQELEWCRLMAKHGGGWALIVLPLGVRQEFTRDAVKLLGWPEAPQYVRTMQEAKMAMQRDTENKVLLTNYERVRDGDIDPEAFTCTSLDEASVLRSFGSKTYQTFLEKFRNVKYKLVATATPSPNRYKELTHYASYLGVMDSGQALTRFFQRNSQKANDLTIYPHKVEEFWLWVSTWALFIQKPSDLGYDDSGYELPPLDVRYHRLTMQETDYEAERDGQVRLYRDAALGLSQAAKEKRESIETRVQMAESLLKGWLCGANEGRTESVLQEVVSGTPRRIADKAAGEEQKELSGEETGIQCEKQEVEGIEPRALQGIDETQWGTSQGTKSRNFKELLSEQQGERIGENEGTQTQEIRIDTAGICENGGGTRKPLCDLQKGTCDTREGQNCLHRSLPCDGEGSGASVHEMQFHSGNGERQCGSLAERDRLPQAVVWCDLNREQEALEKMFKRNGWTYSSLTGTQTMEEREELMEQWRDKKTQIFLTKPEMYGQGVNLQQCSYMIFLGIDYEFEKFIQAIHREYRYKQESIVQVHVLYMDTEDEILNVLKAKWKRHDEMVERMAGILREYGMHTREAAKRMQRSIGVDRMEVTGKHYKAVLNDCIQETAQMNNDSVDLIVTSIPFSNHYEYTASYNDFGHNEDTDRFFEQMDYLSPNLLRVLKPGRIFACHTKDRVLFGSQTGTGMPSIEPFHDLTTLHYMKHGFQYIGMITVVTDVVRENNQTYRLGWSEQCKDGSKMGVGCPEYVLLFRKLPSSHEKAYADIPVEKSKEKYTRAQWQIDAHAFWRSSGDRLLSKEELENVPVKDLQRVYRKFSRENVYSYEDHVALARKLDEKGSLPATFMVVAPGSWQSDVWDDIVRMRTLNSEQAKGNRQLHVCPLQTDLVDRLINRYSNPGETVYDPFGGLMTVPVEAVKLGREGIGCELNAGYFRDGVGYLEQADAGRDNPSLFDFIGEEAQ